MMKIKKIEKKFPNEGGTDRKNILHKEPSVISEELLKKCLMDQLPKNSLGEMAKREGVRSTDAEEISLEFQNISQIANISHMLNLKKLKLSNNIITKIEQLDSLTNLTHLDLSFNSIKKIENLNSLAKLEVLILHRNLISELENMDNLLYLKIFNISNNRISQLETFKYMRKFLKLRSICVEGNKVIYENSNYKDYIIAYVPQLTRIDYQVITKEDREAANAKFKNDIENLQEREDLLKRRASVVEADLQVNEVRKNAFLDGVEEESLWLALYNEDDDGKYLLSSIDAGDTEIIFHELFTRTVKDMFESGMKSLTDRQNEFKAFNTAIESEKQFVQRNGKELTQNFLVYYQVATKEMTSLLHMMEDLERRHLTNELEKEKLAPMLQENQERLNTQVLEFVKELHLVWYTLMTDQIFLHEQIATVSQKFQNELESLIKNWLEEVFTHFAGIREVETNYYKKLLEIIEREGEFKIGRQNETELQKQQFGAKNISLNKEAEAFGLNNSNNVGKVDELLNKLQSSHEYHLKVIQSKEEEIINQSNAWLQYSLKKLKVNEVHRFRMRISEISHFVDYHRKRLDELNIIKRTTCVIPERKVRKDGASNNNINLMTTEEEEEEFERLSGILSSTMANGKDREDKINRVAPAYSKANSLADLLSSIVKIEEDAQDDDGISELKPIDQNDNNSDEDLEKNNKVSDSTFGEEEEDEVDDNEEDEEVDEQDININDKEKKRGSRRKKKKQK